MSIVPSSEIAGIHRTSTGPGGTHPPFGLRQAVFRVGPEGCILLGFHADDSGRPAVPDRDALSPDFQAGLTEFWRRQPGLTQRGES